MSSKFSLEGLFYCKICEELLTNPVCIPCGDNFCRKCIKIHWDSKYTNGEYICPSCRAQFCPRPETYRNKVVEEILEQIRRAKLWSSFGQSKYAPMDELEQQLNDGTSGGVRTDPKIQTTKEHKEKESKEIQSHSSSEDQKIYYAAPLKSEYLVCSSAEPGEKITILNMVKPLHNAGNRNQSEPVVKEKSQPSEQLKQSYPSVPNVQRVSPRSPRGSLSDSGLRIMLLGRSGVGKSTVGNRILGREEFNINSSTTECEVKDVVRDGQTVTVFDTPGFFSGQTTNEEISRKITKYLEQTSSTPFLYLLVVDMDNFTDDDKRTLKIIQCMLDRRKMARNVMVLFNTKLPVKSTNISEYIEPSNETLQQLLAMCNNKYLVGNAKLMNYIHFKKIFSRNVELYKDSSEVDGQKIKVKEKCYRRRGSIELIPPQISKTEKHTS